MTDSGSLDGGATDGGVPPGCPVVSSCGDGRVEGGEGCDDGDADDADGCSDCQVDDGFTCFSSPSRCYPDDELLYVPGDAPTAAAALEDPRSVIVLERGFTDPGSLVIDKAVTLLGQPGASVVDDDGDVGIEVRAGGDLHLVGLYLETSAGSGSDEVLFVRAGGALTLEDATVDARRAAVRAAPGSSVVLRRNDLRGGQGGLWLATSDYQVEGNFIHGSGAFTDGISASVGGVRFEQAPAPGSFFRFNTVFDNAIPAGGQAAGVHCDVADVDIESTIVWGNESPALSPSCDAVNSLVQGAGDAGIGIDPLLDEDGRLLPGSPAIDAALGFGPARDRDLDLRPAGEGFDIGADERDDERLPVIVRAEARVRASEVAEVPVEVRGAYEDVEIVDAPVLGTISGSPPSISFQGAVPGRDTLALRPVRADGCPGPTTEIGLVVFPADWWDVDWATRQTFIFDATNDQDLDDFPALVRLGTQEAFSWEHARADGQDLRFIDEAGSEVAYEIERWDDGSEALLWVRLPTLPPEGATLALYAGHPTAPPPSPGPEAVWPAPFEAVYHFSDDGGADRDDDATSRGLDLDATPPEVEGPIGDAFTVGGAGIALEDQPVSLLRDADGFTLTCLVRATSTSDSTIIGVAFSGGVGSRASLEVSPGGNARALGRAEDGSSPSSVDAQSALPTDGSWAMLAAVGDLSDDELTIYVDNAETTSSVDFTGSATSDTDAQIATLGANESFSTTFDGDLDECRIEREARSTDWVLATRESLLEDIIATGQLEVP